MSFNLPQEMYKPELGREKQRVSVSLIAAVLALFCAWQLLGLPGSLVQEFRPEADMPWHGFGLQGLFIEADGTWTVTREGYADRMGKYLLFPDGGFEKYPQSGLYGGDDVSGCYRGVGVMMARRSTLNVSPDSSYWEFLRAKRGPDGRRSPKAHEFSEDAAKQYSFPDDALFGKQKQESIYVETWGSAGYKGFPVLAGSHYFPVFDAACFIDPDLWMTTDQLTRLHHIHASDAGEEVEVKELQSAGLKIKDAEGKASVLGMDPVRKQLFLLLTDGRRFWFDPATLVPTGEDKLPGYWEREHASIGNTLGRYGLRTGYGLSEAGYFRLMGLMMIVFLGSLLWLAWHWRAPWKFTSAPTTGDSSSSSSSATT